jgi:hypothetical protein
LRDTSQKVKKYTGDLSPQDNDNLEEFHEVAGWWRKYMKQEFLKLFQLILARIPEN